MKPDAELRSSVYQQVATERPPRWFVEQANVTDPELRERFEAEWPECWSAAGDLLDWTADPEAVLVGDDRGHRWFEGGRLNACHNCVDRHVESGEKNRVAMRWLGRMGEVRTYTYQDLHREVNEVAAALRSLGVAEDDVVTLYLPNVPELPITMLACARIGALHAVVSAGFSANALAERMSQSGSPYLVTCDGFYRRGEAVDQRRKAENARLTVPHEVEEFVVIERLGHGEGSSLGRGEHAYEELVAGHAGETVEPVDRDANDELFHTYTSGTTGDPMKVRHRTGGYLAHAAWTSRAVLDLTREDTYWCTADIGWITGHSYVVYGPLALGVTTVLSEGSADRPERDRVWETIERNAVDVFYTAPTVISALRKHGADAPDEHDLSSLRLLGTVGEPISRRTWEWYREEVGDGSTPIVDTWWQTETGGMMATTLPGVDEMRPGFAGRPLPGIGIEVVDEAGEPAEPGQAGYLFVTRPWPGMPVSLAEDDGRLDGDADRPFRRDDGWSYFTEDRAVLDRAGRLRLLGRVDDVVTVEEARFTAMTFESAILDLEGVAEAAVVDGQADHDDTLYAFVSVVDESETDPDSIRSKVGEVVGENQVEIVFTPELPKTRSGKIMRRLLRDVTGGEEVEDTSALCNPEIVGELRSVLHEDG